MKVNLAVSRQPDSFSHGEAHDAFQVTTGMNWRERRRKVGKSLSQYRRNTDECLTRTADKKRAINGKRRDSDDSDSDRPKKSKAKAKANGKRK